MICIEIFVQHFISKLYFPILAHYQIPKTTIHMMQCIAQINGIGWVGKKIVGPFINNATDQKFVFRENIFWKKDILLFDNCTMGIFFSNWGSQSSTWELKKKKVKIRWFFGSWISLSIQMKINEDSTAMLFWPTAHGFANVLIWVHIDPKISNCIIKHEIGTCVCIYTYISK